MAVEARFRNNTVGTRDVAVFGSREEEPDQTQVYVDWDRIESMIEDSGIDLDPYRGSTLWYMAEQLGHSWQSMKRIRRTGSTTLKTLGRMADVLDVSPFDLLTVEPVQQ